MQSMAIKENIEFSERMNRVADLLKIPPAGKNRQAVLGKMFDLSQEAARKWLSGESLPQLSKCIEIANRANISIEWLLTGKGAMFNERYQVTQELTAHLKVMQQLPDYARTEVMRDAIKTAELIAQATQRAKSNGTTQ